jgi:hypothetical protein
MKRLAIVLLVLLVVIIGIPLGGMAAMAFCPECLPTDGQAGLGLCIALLLTITFLLPALGARTEAGSLRRRQLLLVAGLDRPPQRG